MAERNDSANKTARSTCSCSSNGRLESLHYNIYMIYLDNNATTAVSPEVRDAMLPYLTEAYGNPSSMHRFGQESRQAIEKARHQVANLLGCETRELLFTSGGTESDNAAIHGVLAARPNRKTIITSTVEHSAIREPLAALAKAGHRVIEIPVNSLGQLDLQALEKALGEPDIALATIMWANNETGVLFDIPAVGNLCKTHQVPLHVDAVQAVGKLPLELRSLPIDLLSTSAHKIHGPKGVGALYVRRNTRWLPLIRGGPQERERRGGTENVPGIVGFGAAAQRAGENVSQNAYATAGKLRDIFEKQILDTISDTSINGDTAHRLPTTTNISFHGLEAEAILLLLSERDICASAGAACASGSLEPSHVLRAMHLPDPIAHGAIRFSLSLSTTEAELKEAAQGVAAVIARLRSVLPV
jgi:cysteine desulfurase